MGPTLADSIDALLPQTQCTKCGYEGCRPYAEAIAEGAAEINQCPPGGATGIAQLARLLGRPALRLNPENGIEQPLRVAIIDEALCIGCTLCIPACPVDAIVGAPKRMHSVIASRCTGCDLCLPPCPMDCIRMIPVQPVRTWTEHDAHAARRRFEARRERKRSTSQSLAPMLPEEPKDTRVAAAVERARQRRAAAAQQPG
jgi:Na+-translocating ferredoxin:NAD+ oxidoreductase subunit B